MHEIVKASKRQQENSNPGYLYRKPVVLNATLRYATPPHTNEMKRLKPGKSVKSDVERVGVNSRE